MRDQTAGPSARARSTSKRGDSGLRTVACILMVTAAVGLLSAFALGAPLVSILLAGVLLLCPLLMWAPFRIPSDAGMDRDGDA